jgi:hypothetical protein
MKIPCVQRLPFIIVGLTFLQPALTRIQFDNLTLIATALILGSKFSLSEISRLWLKEKSVSTLSHFLSDAKFSTQEMQHLYALRVMHFYQIRKGYFIIDDTMLHRSNFCKWIHGVFVQFDHALNTNLRAICIVVLYYSDGCHNKCALNFRIYFRETVKMPWQRGKQFVCKTKHALAIELLEWALEQGYPKCIVLADSWFGVGPFVKELQRLKLSYVIEIKRDLNVRVACKEPKLTPTGRLAKNQYDLKKIRKFFESIATIRKCGFDADEQKGRKSKVLYLTKIANIRLNSIPGKHRIVESFCPATQTTKYLLTNELTWETAKIIEVYSCR